MSAVERGKRRKTVSTPKSVVVSCGTVSREEHEEILTDVTVLSSPSLKAVTVISTNQIFARVSIFARLSHTFIYVCGLRRKRARMRKWEGKKIVQKKGEKNPRSGFVAPPPSGTSCSVKVY